MGGLGRRRFAAIWTGSPLRGIARVRLLLGTAMILKTDSVLCVSIVLYLLEKFSDLFLRIIDGKTVSPFLITLTTWWCLER